MVITFLKTFIVQRQRKSRCSIVKGEEGRGRGGGVRRWVLDVRVYSMVMKACLHSICGWKVMSIFQILNLFLFLIKLCTWRNVSSPDSKTMLGQRWHRVVRLAYDWSWKYNVGQHCPYVNILSSAVGSITSWNQYVVLTLGQCTSVACFNMTELCWVHCVGPNIGP